MERVLNDSTRVPLSTYVLINEDEVLDVIDQMRTAIPQEVRQGERIQQERDRIIAQAEEEAGRIVELAQVEAEKQVDEHDVIHAANQRSETIIERAQREANALKDEADEYARGVLLSLDDQLGVLDGQIDTLMHTVRNGLKTLATRGEPEPEPDKEA